MKTLYLYLILCFTVACSRQAPVLTVQAPELAGDTCTIHYNQRAETFVFDSQGIVRVKITPLLTFGNVYLKSSGQQIHFYTGQKDLIIHLDSKNEATFEGEHAEASRYHSTAKYPSLAWYFVKDAGREELDTYLQKHADTLNYILTTSGVKDPEFIRLQKEEFKYMIESFRNVFLFTKGLITPEDIRSHKSLLAEDEALLPLSNYGYALYRFPKELILYQQRDSIRLPHEYLHDILDYYVEHYNNPGIRENVIHRMAEDYMYMQEQGNDPYLDKIYRTHVTDTLLIKKYNELSAKWQHLWSGKPCAAPAATDLAGEGLNLDRYKGKYLLIDIWATWCRPCTREQDIMFKIEPEFKDKNIEFITLSCDKHRKAWEMYCKKHKMTGDHHYNIQDMDALFRLYAIRTIPRFILLDPEGKLLSANFFKPSDPKFKRTLNHLLEN